MSTREKESPSPQASRPEQVKKPEEVAVEQDPWDPERQKVIFDVSASEHELVARYQPKFLAKGGEHVIYDVPGHPDVVAKVPTEQLKRIIDGNAKHGESMDAFPKAIEPHIRAYLKQENERFKKLKKYFGSEHVLGQRKFFAKVPITESILSELYRGNPPAKGNEAWSVIMVQRRAEELSDPERLAVVSGYSEMRGVDPDAYHAATSHLIFGKDGKERLGRKKFLTAQPKSGLRKLLDRSDHDASLRDALRDFLEKTIDYTEETGEVLDLAGSDNVAFSKKGDVWNYRLVDALYPSEKNMVDKTKMALLKLSMEVPIDEGEKNILLNTFNYVRTINGLAEELGIDKRINVVPKTVHHESMDFLKIIGEGEVQK